MAQSHFNHLILKATKKNIPLDVLLELTHRCNFRCQHCYIPDFSVPNLLTTERIIRLLEELAEMGTLFLTLSGGEMFLRKDWLTIARKARSLGFSLRLFTNASLIDETIADAVAHLPAPVEVSFYSARPQVFETVTQAPGSFAKTVRGIKLLRERNVPVLLKIPLMTLNAGEYPEVVAFAQSMGAECRIDTKIVGKKDGDKSPLRLRLPEYRLMEYYRGPYSSCVTPEELQDPRPEGGPLCAAAVRFCAITATGDVQACPILPGSGGNIREKSFREVWESSPWLNKVRSIRRKDLPVCGTCSKLAYCGRCHAQALVEDGNILGPSRWACEHAATMEALALENKSA